MALLSKVQLTRGKLALTLVPECGACGLHRSGCKSPKMQPTGEGRRKVLLVGDGPGQTEDEVGRQFVGESGQVLRAACLKAGVNIDRDCWLTYSVICHPGPAKAVDHCRANLLQTIKKHDPEVIVLLGSAAIKSLIGHVWKEDPGQATRWAGAAVPCVNPNAWVCPTDSPKDVLKDKSGVAAAFLERHLKAAFALKGRPWSCVPNYEKEVEVEFDPDRAAKVIRAMARAGKPVAFDYETNMLKPDSPRARIASVAFCDGGRTISALWKKSVADATLELVTGRCPLVGWNMKFESRWTKRILGRWPRGWVYDGMQAAHVHDFRAGLTGLKYQSFVLFGTDDYAAGVKPYLSTPMRKGEEGGNAENQIFDLVRQDARSLLLYGGIDALLEWKVWDKQRTLHAGFGQRRST